jgi:hypothetical protein
MASFELKLVQELINLENLTENIEVWVRNQQFQLNKLQNTITWNGLISLHPYRGEPVKNVKDLYFWVSMKKRSIKELCMYISINVIMICNYLNYGNVSLESEIEELTSHFYKLTKNCRAKYIILFAYLSEKLFNAEARKKCAGIFETLYRVLLGDFHVDFIQDLPKTRKILIQRLLAANKNKIEKINTFVKAYSVKFQDYQQTFVKLRFSDHPYNGYFTPEIIPILAIWLLIKKRSSKELSTMASTHAIRGYTDQKIIIPNPYAEIFDLSLHYGDVKYKNTIDNTYEKIINEIVPENVQAIMNMLDNLVDKVTNEHIRNYKELNDKIQIGIAQKTILYLPPLEEFINTTKQDVKQEVKCPTIFPYAIAPYEATVHHIDAVIPKEKIEKFYDTIFNDYLASSPDYEKLYQ